jgi:F-type H+-transporting ATPase subunit b
MDRVFGLDQQTLITIAIQLFNVSLLAAVLSWLLYKPVRRFLQKRSDSIRAQIERVQDDQAMADKLRGYYEQELEGIDQQRLKAMDEAHRIANQKREQMLADAKKDIAAMREKAHADIEAERERVSEEIRLHIIEVATAMAGKFVEHSIDAQSHARLFDETLAELEDMA